MFAKKLVSYAAMAIQAVSATNVLLLSPDATATGEPLAVVWILGANYSATAYTQIAQEFQLKAAEQGYKAWVGIPEFLFDTPNPAEIGPYIQDTVDYINQNGFTGDNWFMAAHSLGGVMTQDWLDGSWFGPDPSMFKGQILMSSALLRDKRSIQEDGTSLFNITTPTLTLGGSKDGLMRVTRIAESYWHQITNINPSQENMFPVKVLEGVAHYQFAGGVPPSFVQSNDLRADVADADARVMVADAMATFMNQVLTGTVEGTDDATTAYLDPLLQGMYWEGSYVMKDACYQSTLVNVPTPQCLKGSPWVQERALKTLVGDLADSEITLTNDDNFHRASTVYPYHHPDVQQTCEGTTGPCEIIHISNTENAYATLNELDLGTTPIAAVDMKVKMKSSQYIHIAAREPDADYDADDMQWDECEKVNQEVLDWAMSVAGTDALSNYDTYGQKLEMGQDKEAINGGTWIIQDLEFKKIRGDDSKIEVISVSLPIPETAIVPIFRSMHYCKMLSPFRALEWIYVDSQYKFGGYTPQSVEEEAYKFLTA